MIAVLTGAALAVLAAAAMATSAPPPTHVVAAYFADYDSGFNAADIPAERLTDVIYAFGAIDAQRAVRARRRLRRSAGALPGQPARAGWAARQLRAARAAAW